MSDAPSIALRYSPIDHRRVLDNPQIQAHRDVMFCWVMSVFSAIALGLLLRALGVHGLPLFVGGAHGAMMLDAPLLIFAPMALWFGLPWAIAGAWLSGSVVLLGEVSLLQVPFVSLGNTLGLVVLSMAFRVAPVPTSLRSSLTLPFYLVVALFAAIVASTGELIGDLTTASRGDGRMMGWYDAWPGTFAQLVFIVGPILAYFGPRVAAWKQQRGLGELWTTPSPAVIGWTLGIGVGALSVLVIGDRLASTERLGRLLAQARGPAFVATPEWTSAVREAAAPAGMPFLSILLLACVGLVAYELAQRWWQADERMQAARLAAEARSAALLDAIPDLVLHMRADGTVLGHKDGLGLLGRTEVVGRSITTVWPSRITHPLLGRVEEALTKGSAVVEFRLASEKGVRDLEARVVALGREEVIALVRDVSRPKSDPRYGRELVRTLTRDLRAPLTSVRGALGLLRSGAAEELGPKAAQLIHVAWRNTEKMVRVAEEIGDGNSSRDGAVRTLKIENVDLATLVEASVLERRREAETLRLALEMSLPDEESRVRGDPERIVDVMHTLLSNALRFSPMHNRVKVSLKRVSDVLRVEVADEGQGIPEAFQPRVFRGEGGNGRGYSLSTAREIVLALGGRIGFESKLGRGSTFWFELPERAEDTEEVPVTEAAGA